MTSNLSRRLEYNRVELRAEQFLKPPSIDALLVTHEYTDAMSLHEGQSPFSIRPIKAPSDRKPKTLVEFIARVNATHPGGFRGLSETDVKRQIEEKKHQQNGDADTHMDDGAASEEDADTDTVKDLGAARNEVLRNISIAWIQANNAQQMISLLMSKEAPTQAMGTLDPDLRTRVGIGTLGSTKLHEPPFLEERAQENTAIATGAKMLAINSAADELLAAANRLRTEMAVEAQYWHEVLAVKEGGWPVSRLPNDPVTVAVKFGFSDSPAEFQANSWAALSREDSGSVNLQTPRLIAEPKQLLVSMHRNGRVFGRSTLTQPLSPNAPLELRVREARNTVLAQELWHEINREARSLLAYNVRLLPESVAYALDDRTTITFTLSTLGDPPEDTPAPLPCDSYAESIRSALHLLLTYAHRQSARKRTAVQPLSKTTTAQSRPPRQPYNLLKPVIAHLQHETWLRATIRFVSDLTAVLRLSGIASARFALEEHPLPFVAPQGASEQLLGTLLSNPVAFRVDLTLTPEVRATMVGITGIGGGRPSSVVRFLPPVVRGTEQPASLLGAIYPPADVYESLGEAFGYLRGATVRALAKHAEILAKDGDRKSVV